MKAMPDDAFYLSQTQTASYEAKSFVLDGSHWIKRASKFLSLLIARFPFMIVLIWIHIVDVMLHGY
jgi:hypothetical protein